LNPLAFSSWQVLRIRGYAQVDNLTVGTVIPEPNAAMLGVVAGVGVFFLKRMRKK